MPRKNLQERLFLHHFQHSFLPASRGPTPFKGCGKNALLDTTLPHQSLRYGKYLNNFLLIYCSPRMDHLQSPQQCSSKGAMIFLLSGQRYLGQVNALPAAKKLQTDILYGLYQTVNGRTYHRASFTKHFESHHNRCRDSWSLMSPFWDAHEPRAQPTIVYRFVEVSSSCSIAGAYATALPCHTANESGSSDLWVSAQ